ncbi:MAG: CRTAC1 family protein, partial [Phycisphaerae bacterium]
NYVDYDPDYRLFYAPDGFPGPLAFTGQQDKLFRGNTDSTFTDVTAKAGIAIKPVGRAMGVAAVDYDEDGFADIFVSNDAMENFLFHNEGDGTFENQAWLAGVAFGQSGEATAAMGVEVADYDGDGLFDVFVPDMTYTCLYRNMGQGLFEEQAARSGIAPVMGQYVGWGGVFADFDLDGQLDLYISNGDVHHLEPHEDVLFVGNGGRRFTDASASAGEWMTKQHVGRGVAGADFDNDGDVDLLVTHLNDRPVLLRNDTPRHGRHWLAIKLIGRTPNCDAIGAVVKMRVGGTTIWRGRRSGGGYLSQHDWRLHFGLGEHDRVESLSVTWPDGSLLTLKNVRADQALTVRQAVSTAGIGK